ncbi:MAG: ATP-binding protein [Pseudomonadota bacterium]
MTTTSCTGEAAGPARKPDIPPDAPRGPGGRHLSRHRLAERGLCAWLIALMLLLGATGAGAVEHKQVMLLFSFGQEFRPWSEYARSIRAELDRRSPWPLDFTDHSLISARLGDEGSEAAFLAYLRTLYSKNQPDLIVAVGAPAAGFIQQHRRELFPASPMLLTAIEQRRVQFSKLTENDAAVTMHIDYLKAMENILQVMPDTRHVAVVVGTSPIEKFWRAEIAREIKPLEGRVTFTWFDTLSFEDILKTSAALPPQSAIFWELMLVDAAGVVHEGNTALTRLHAVANAPIFSYDDSFFGNEIVGGPLLSVREGSRQTAEAAIRILGGEKPGALKIPPVEFAPPKFDWREMQRWGISESRLLLGSEIAFREPTLFERHRMQIVGIAAVILLQAALISWLLYEQAERRRSEADARELSRRLINAQEEECARLARELHDDVTQRLAMLAITAARQKRETGAVNGNSSLQSMHDGLVRLSEDVHALSYRLHPSILTDLGLIEALRSECETFTQSPIRLKLDAKDIPRNVAQDIALCLYRIAQESLRNVARHSGATRTEVSLQRVDGGLQLAVRDNGVGFDVRKRRAGMSLGLASMRQRIMSLDGRLAIESRPGRGTSIVAWIKLREPDAAPSERASA